MGQYFQAVIFDEDKKVVNSYSSWQTEDGAKMGEHCYIGNEYVDQICIRLIPNGEFYKKQIIWGGDYSNILIGTTNKNAYELGKNFLKGIAINEMIDGLCIPLDIYPNLKACGKYLDTKTLNDYPILVNHTLKEYVDLRKVPNHYDLQFHPICFLTCDITCEKIIETEYYGMWLENTLSLEKEIPTDFIEIEFNLSPKSC